jgi:hypothetical protein
VSSRRRASTGPSRWKNIWIDPSAGPRTEEPRRRHPDLRVVGHDRDVRHQRELEPATEREAADLGDGDLRVAEEEVVEVERPAVDEEPAALTGPPLRAGAIAVVAVGLRRAVAVPGVRVVHVGAGAEHATFAAQEHHLDVVVVGELLEMRAQLLAHRGVVGVLALRVVEGDARDGGSVLPLDVHSTVAHSAASRGDRFGASASPDHTLNI